MAKFTPVKTVMELLCLDGDEVEAGNAYGKQGGVDPSKKCTLSFWHGWRCGRVNGGFVPMVQDQFDLLNATRFILFPPSHAMH